VTTLLGEKATLCLRLDAFGDGRQAGAPDQGDDGGYKGHVGLRLIDAQRQRSVDLELLERKPVMWSGSPSWSS